MKKLTFKFTLIQFTEFHNVCVHCIFNYVPDEDLNRRLCHLIMQKLYMRILQKRMNHNFKMYSLILSDQEAIAFFLYFNPVIQSMGAYEAAIIQPMCDKIHKKLL